MEVVLVKRRMPPEAFEILKVLKVLEQVDKVLDELLGKQQLLALVAVSALGKKKTAGLAVPKLQLGRGRLFSSLGAVLWTH